MFKVTALVVAPLVLILGGVYIFSPGVRVGLSHWLMGVQVTSAEGAEFLGYEVVKKGKWHNPKFNPPGVGTAFQDQGWVYFRVPHRLGGSRQMMDEEDFLKGNCGLVETPDGEKIPRPIETDFDEGKIVAVSLPERMPPSLKTLDVSLLQSGKQLAKVHLTRLPPNRWTTPPDAKTEAAYQSGKVKISASAKITAPESKSGWKWLEYRLNFDGINPKQFWKVNNLNSESPYLAPSDTSNKSLDSGSVSFELNDRITTGTCLWNAYHSHIRRLKVVGSLDRYETQEETVDFGELEVKNNPRPHSDQDAYYLTITQPIVKVLSDGAKVILTPLLDSKSQNATYMGRPLHIRLAAEPPSTVPDDGSYVVEAQLAKDDRYFEGLFPPSRSTHMPDLRFMKWNGKGRTIRLKFVVRTLTRKEHHPFALVVPVEQGEANDRLKAPISPYWPTSMWIK